MLSRTPGPDRGKILFVWSCGLLAATPIWFGLMLVLASAVGVHGDSGNAVLDAVGSLVTLAPGIAALVLAGLAFRADHRWWYFIPAGVIVAIMTLWVVPPYLDGQASPWMLLVPIVSAALTAVPALWPHRSPSAVSESATLPTVRGDDARHVS